MVGLTSEKFHSHNIIKFLTWQCSVILDGEMLVWDPVSERNLPFGTLKSAALGQTPPCAVIPSF